MGTEMAEEQQTDKKASEPDQTILADREARRSEMMYQNLDSGGLKGIRGIIIWFIVVVLIFALMYFLS